MSGINAGALISAMQSYRLREYEANQAKKSQTGNMIGSIGSMLGTAAMFIPGGQVIGAGITAASMAGKGIAHASQGVYTADDTMDILRSGASAALAATNAFDEATKIAELGMAAAGEGYEAVAADVAEKFQAAPGSIALRPDGSTIKLPPAGEVAPSATVPKVGLDEEAGGDPEFLYDDGGDPASLARDQQLNRVVDVRNIGGQWMALTAGKQSFFNRSSRRSSSRYDAAGGSGRSDVIGPNGVSTTIKRGSSQDYNNIVRLENADQLDQEDPDGVEAVYTRQFYNKNKDIVNNFAKNGGVAWVQTETKGIYDKFFYDEDGGSIRERIQFDPLEEE